MATDALPLSRRRSLAWLKWTLLAVAVGFLTAALAMSPKRKTEEPPLSAALETVPPFALTERSGKPINNADLAGKVWVASFVFTRCTGPCPSVTATMARLQSELDLVNQPDLRLVTFTFDPDNDSTGELAKYADHFRAHPDRWHFLTGKEDELHRLAKNCFKIGVNANPDAAAPVGEKYQHTTYVAVVDKQGRVRGHFHGFPGKQDGSAERFDENLKKLKETVTQLLAE